MNEGGRPNAEGGGVGAAVLVSSCDRFFDVWRPFAGFWRRHWPAHILRWPVYLVVNELAVRSGWLTPLAVGRDRGWSDNLRLVLGRIEADYVLYLQEDYFLTASPDAEWLEDTLERMKAGRVDLLCLRAMPPGYGAEGWPRVPGSEGRVSEIPEGSPWRGRLQAAFWRRESLLAALRAGESAWTFEANAGERLRGLRAWTVTPEGGDALPYLSSAVVRGLWTPEARRICVEQGIAIEPGCRGTSSANRRLCKCRRALGRVRLPLAAWRQRRRGAVGL